MTVKLTLSTFPRPASLDFSQQRVNGEVRLRLYKGNAYCLGRTSQEKLYSEEDASMDSLTTFDPSETVSRPAPSASHIVVLPCGSRKASAEC